MRLRTFLRLAFGCHLLVCLSLVAFAAYLHLREANQLAREHHLMMRNIPRFKSVALSTFDRFDRNGDGLLEVWELHRKKGESNFSEEELEVMDFLRFQIDLLGDSVGGVYSDNKMPTFGISRQDLNQLEARAEQAFQWGLRW